ncbi:unnamed protein product [Pseudo-nitzschia multistriata]|uniref:dolichyl-phosphate beta-glucosyltransferase n=1 Tax=Pseudo-nitzschia multistriata TaxID=183589 RepID=A0A448ZH26_9STRA|nr:unnamed protein product [Pseudo-nitzschia multistriata]
MITFIEIMHYMMMPVTATFAFLWVFYPAWAVLIAERIEWDVEDLASPGMNKDSFESPLLTLVIPAFNEEDRIPIMIRETFDYLTSQQGKQLLRKLQSSIKPQTTSSLEYEKLEDASLREESSEQRGAEPKVEWIIVDDGSTDATCDVVRETYKKLMGNKSNGVGKSTPSATNACDWKWKIVSLTKNAGKGGAVKTGMNLAEGMFHLMVDADGATDFGNGLENLTRELRAHTQGILASREGHIGSRKGMAGSRIAVFGSRAHLERESTAQRSFVRTLLMKAFHFFVSLFVSTKVHDTQCGFKLFSKKASNAIFKTLHLRRWAFDTEIVLLCDKQCIDIIEVAVRWKEVDGSKLSTSKLALALVSISMLRDMICVRACYTLGFWRVKMGL